MAEDINLFWTQEYTGEGNGSLPDRPKKENSESYAITFAGLTLGAASALTLLAF